MKVNAPRLLKHLDQLAQIGRIPGDGVCRLAFSEEDKAGRDYVEHRMRALGMQVSIDSIGNILGIRPGQSDGPVVLTGSHTDTVATGGRFDGSLGVLAALEVIERLNEEQITTEKPVGVVSFVNEEGVRFMPDMLGSLFLRGDLSVEEVRDIVGIDGTTIGQNLDKTGYAGQDDFRGIDIAHFIELHIEQGPWLETENKTIGVVDRVQGIRWLEFTFDGIANHAGATPMFMRKDAGLVAGALTCAVRELVDEIGGDQRATVGAITLKPNLINVIARQATVTVDLRNPDPAMLSKAEAHIVQKAHDIAAQEGVGVSVRKLADVVPVTFNQQSVAAIERAANALGLSHQKMISGAAHDAQILAGKYPAAMIFVPSKNGISHNVEEYTSPEHIEAGANVLLHTITALAGAG